ncbi:MAG: HAMP domain-containing histidine kinase [Bacteroidales bacterium]|jgi:nitrogen fixation/metabolism regulation signal transduction histidine kinase|nr:HAMP domain-containing histidine kinase [Bacteroidales bacterium]
MPQHKAILILRLSNVVLLAVAMGALLTTGHYWLSGMVFLILLWRAVDLGRWMNRSTKDMKRFIEAVRFNEFNISFRPAIGKGLPKELAHAMEESLAQFRIRLMQAETEQMFYDTLLQRIDSGIMALNKYGTVEWINKTAVDMFGKPQPRKLDDLENASPDLPGILEQLAPREVKLLTINRDGTAARYAVTATYFSAGGKDLKLISLKNIQPALEEHESDAWRKLIRVLTHEIMNSITPIISLAETLAEPAGSKQDDVLNRAIQTIHRRSRGLVDFVKNYQQLTRIPEPVLAETPAKEVLSDISRLLQADGIRFTFHVAPPDMQIIADRALTEQVLINLIKNAWEACCELPNPEVTVDIHKNEYQRPVATITDNGYGIVPDVLDKVFVPFFTTKTGGSGIGLSICRQIMNLHHGSISIESEVDRGTVVTLRF